MTPEERRQLKEAARRAGQKRVAGILAAQPQDSDPAVARAIHLEVANSYDHAALAHEAQAIQARATANAIRQHYSDLDARSKD